MVYSTLLGGIAAITRVTETYDLYEYGEKTRRQKRIKQLNKLSYPWKIERRQGLSYLTWEEPTTGTAKPLQWIPKGER